ncbi:DUF3078 domain-containing protein [Flavimarina sp. Hel_I_48]|uniref:DUF3078 domain-containing protein n=1 Tax=Flavimarina sp. Hel_I_48 TaxID=1392488 RepID=UPI0004DF56CE|nr:DUF3078 domain-containing protein [Flavimarina sp. Hel_I_48]
MKNIVLSFFLLFAVSFSFAQTEQELKAAKKEKKDSISAIEKRVNALQKQIDNLPGWKLGAFGTIGGSFSGFNNWYSQGTPNVSAGNIGFTVNAFANLKEPKYFWRNALNVNIAWVKFDDQDDPTDDDSFQESTDVFNVSSLYGYKLTEKFAISALGEYRTTILSNFNDPGYLDLGLGGTWTPLDNLTVTVNPLNYNIVFSQGENIYESTLGAKFLVDYTREIGAISFKSNLSAFQSYKNSDFSNFTWINAFGYTLWKNIGVGFEFGMRDNKAEALDYARNKQSTPDPDVTFDNVDNKLQTYYLLGLNYKF